MDVSRSGDAMGNLRHTDGNRPAMSAGFFAVLFLVLIFGDRISMSEYRREVLEAKSLMHAS